MSAPRLEAVAALSHGSAVDIRSGSLAVRLAETDKEIDAAQALRSTAIAELPPLIKGYLRLGGLVGDGAVIDRQFNTTDVCIVVKTDPITEKYYRYYERQARDAPVL